tara:strand:+ start:5564 stop:6508 length:945 start_codon:yes stop_codon:yes gene_type:complete
MHKYIYIVKTGRGGLLRHLRKYFSIFRPEMKIKIISLTPTKRILKYSKQIKNNEVDYFVISNGSDPVDVKLKRRILDINPEQKFLFSEYGWLPWKSFLLLDRKGIGNHSSIFDMDMSQIHTNINNDLREYTHHKIRAATGRGKKVPYKNYVMVPLQINNDSKLKIGSPHFKRVEEFVDYIVSCVPKDVQILFKNHPEAKKNIPIPKLPNVIDVTKSGYSKKSLIENAQFVAGINSTFLLESLFYKQKTIAYGLDVFSNKGIVLDGFGKTYDEILAHTPNHNHIDKFIDLLISRQIPQRDSLGWYDLMKNNKGVW